MKDQRYQSDINKKGAKILALLSGEIDHYKYSTGDQSQMIKQAKFTYSPPVKAFEK